MLPVMFKKILIATDGSKHSQSAARLGIELARVCNGSITAVNVIDSSMQTTIYPMGEAGLDIEADVIIAIKRELYKAGSTALTQVENLANDAGMTIEKRIIEGYPAEAILKLADEASMDIIVIGSIGKTDIEKILLGSVAEKVVRNSKLPVLVVPWAGTTISLAVVLSSILLERSHADFKS
jgi:nucleotide-binding universal stress UspA family protein